MTPAIRAVTLPGFHTAMGAASPCPASGTWRRPALRGARRLGLSHARDLDEVAEIVDSFKDRQARTAIRHVVSAVVDWRGQVVTMADRAYLTAAMPMCVIWGTDDAVIPVRHAGNAAAMAPGAMVEVIANAGHFPHKDHPQRFVKIVNDFIRTTRPATYHRGRWRELLRTARPPPLDRARRRSAERRPLESARRA